MATPMSLVAVESIILMTNTMNGGECDIDDRGLPRILFWRTQMNIFQIRCSRESTEMMKLRFTKGVGWKEIL
jgi:hypothetical protein